MKRPAFTYANIMSTLGVFIALGGTSWAVTQLPRNSVGAVQLRSNSVSGVKVRDGSLSAADFSPGALVRGPRGADGPAGPSGQQGSAGPRGPSDGYVHSGPTGKVLATQANVQTNFAELKGLPAGSYVVTATWYMGDFANVGSIAGCNINVNGEFVSGADSVVGIGQGSTRVTAMSTTSGVTRPSPFQASLDCRTDQGLASPPTVFNPRLTAIRLETLRATSG
jgi:hypothetical protein